MIGLIEAILFCAALVAGMTWIIVVLHAPSRAPDSIAPAQRIMRARQWLYAPIWVPVLALGAALAPGLLGGLVGALDHCVEPSGLHHHLCLVHPPHAAMDPLMWGSVLGVLLIGALLLGRVSWRARRETRLIDALVRTSSPSELGDHVRTLDQPEPIALTVGVREPVILLSSGLIDALSQDAIDIIIAHERAHIERRDILWAHLDNMAGALLPIHTRRALIEDIALAREQACDRAAAREHGALHVAASLTAVTRLGLETPALGLSIASSNLSARVHSLLDEPAPPNRVWFVLPLALVMLAGAGPVHDITEHIIGALLH